MSHAAALPLVALNAETRPFAEVVVHTDMRKAQADWAQLEDCASYSAYQRRDWILPWLGSIGRRDGWTPAVIVARDSEGRAVALLPLGVARRGPLRLAEFLGEKDANFTFGLFRPGVTFTRADIEAMMREGARGTPGGIDLFSLFNQPADWEGARNPLLQLPHWRSPADGYKATALTAPGERYLAARYSHDTRKKLRRKEKRLAELGALRHLRARDADEARMILAAFTAQKSARMKEKGLDDTFGSAAAREFLARVAIEPLERGQEPAVELHALMLDGRVVATLAGARAGGRFSGMFNSFDADADISRNSPGDLLAAKVLAEKCDEGLTTFDLGVGDARYKRTFCDAEEQLFDAFFSTTLAGRAMMWVKSRKRRLKRAIKHDPRLWRLVESLRKLRG